MNATQNLLFLMQQMSTSMTLPGVGGQQQSKPAVSFEDMLKKAGENTAPKDKTKPGQADQNTTEKAETPKDSETVGTKPAEGEEEKTAYQMVGTAVDPVAQLLQNSLQPMEETTAAVDVQEVPTVTSAPLETEAPAAEDLQPQLTESAHPEEAVQVTEEPVQQAPQTAEKAAEAPEREVRETKAPLEHRETGSKGEDEHIEGYEAESMERPLFKDAEAAPVKVGERYEIDTSAEDMDSQLTGAVRQALTMGADTVQIHLAPENLGQLTIEMSHDANGALQIVLHTTTAKAGTLLTQHIDSLHAALQNMGHDAVHVEVQRNQESAQQHSLHQQADPDGHGQNQHHQQQRRQQPANSEDFLQQLRLGLFSLEDVI